MDSQARVVIKGERLDLANDLMRVTRIGSLSELVGVMLTRYAKHMVETWEVAPTQFDPTPPPTTSPVAPAPAIAPSKTRPDDGDLFL